ncbi:unnamed protein product [Cunninghamella blakesleeana]
MPSSFVPRPTFDVTLLKGSHYFDAVIPVVGQLETSSIGVSVPIEVYQSNDKQLTVIQQRSPTLKGKKQNLISTLTDFIKEAQFSKVTLLTSLDASRRLDSQISSNPFRVIGDSAIVNDIYQKCSISALETPKEEGKEQNDHLPSSLPGSGITRSLYLALKENDIHVVIFSIFVLEGDNLQDSIAFANTINSYYKMNIKDDKSGPWIAPKSWEFLFGTPFNPDLYQ